MSKIVNLEPIFDSLVIEPVVAKTKTDSGFYLPESSQKQPNLAKVIKVGPDCKSKVKVNDYIVTPKNFQFTTEVEVNGHTFGVMKEENIIAIVNIEN